MQVGGNSNAVSFVFFCFLDLVHNDSFSTFQHIFFQQHNCNVKDANQKYNSRAAQLYRDKLSQLVSNSLKLYGNCLEIPNSHATVESEKHEPQADFWDQTAMSAMSISSTPQQNHDPFKINKNETKLSGDGPNVNLSADNSQKLNDYKPSVIGKKSTAKKSVIILVCF